MEKPTDQDSGASVRPVRASAPKSEEKRGRGRPTLYRPEYAAQARKLCLLGATDPQIADFFEVAVSTVCLWRVQHSEFSEATKVAKEVADAEVERSLFKRAMGYECDEVDIRVVNGEVVKTPIRKIYPPDSTAMIFWLKNRKPKEWRDKIEQELTGPDGGPIQSRIAIEFVSPDGK